MRLVARSTRTVTIPAGSSLVLALVSPPTLLPILPRMWSSPPRLISTRSACRSARIAAISPSREPTCCCSAVCSSCSVSLTRCSSDTIVVAVSSAPSLPRKPSPLCPGDPPSFAKRSRPPCPGLTPGVLACADCGRGLRGGGKPSHSIS
eukprot:scaffold9139_cov64-Phaeocystis_antarctica.AAC.9